jgi:hypothetical protein
MTITTNKIIMILFKKCLTIQADNFQNSFENVLKLFEKRIFRKYRKNSSCSFNRCFFDMN